jgi:hypothetical protein
MALQVQIASPCSESWASMRGDERSRYCQRCSLRVHDLSALSEAEVRALLLKTEGRVCGRLFKRRDGTVITRDCPTGVRALRLRLFRGLAAGAAMLTALVGYRAVTRERSCPSEQDLAEQTAFERVEAKLDERFIEAREALRETESVGWLVDRWFPRPAPVMGRLMMIPIIRSAPASGSAQPPVE